MKTNAHIIISRWLKREITMLDVIRFTGQTDIWPIYQEYIEIEADVQASREIATADDMERHELENIAYQLYADILHEEPGYIEPVIKALQKKRQQQFAAFAAAFNSRRRSHRHTVIAFRAQ